MHYHGNIPTIPKLGVVKSLTALIIFCYIYVERQMPFSPDEMDIE